MNFNNKIRTLNSSRVFNKKIIFGFFCLLLGLTAFMLIVQYAYFENSYDNLHENRERIYRVNHIGYVEGKIVNSYAISGRLVGETLKHDFEEIENFTRIHPALGNPRVKFEEISFYENDNCLYIEPSFFDVFSFQIIKGNKLDLEKPDVVFITESTAKRYFGKEKAMGKQIEYSDRFGTRNFFIGGIVKDAPNNSHFHFDFLFSNANVLKLGWYNNGDKGWTWPNFFTFILLDSHNDYSSLQEKIPLFVENHLNEILSKENIKIGYLLQPLQDIHLSTEWDHELEVSGDKKKVNFLIAISILLLILSLSNFTNLYSLSILDRAKEFGIKYVVGASMKSHFKSFFKDALVYQIVLLFFTLFLVFATYVKFNEIVGITYENPFWKVPFFWIVIASVFIIGTIFFGSYPLLLVSRLDYITILKGKGANPRNTAYKRRIMVILQFSLLLSLIIASLSINRQIAFMQNQDIGVDINNKIVAKVPSSGEFGRRINSIIPSLIDALENDINIDKVTCSSRLPGLNYQNTSFIRKENETEENNKMANYIWVDKGYVGVFKIKLLAGNTFPETPLDFNRRVLLNRSAAELLGFEKPEDAVNRNIVWLGGVAEVLGVIEDYNHLSLKENKAPIVLFEFNTFGSSYLCVGAKENKIKEVLQVLEKKYKEYITDVPYDYFFLDDTYNKQYITEIRFGKMSLLFTIIILVVSTISLFSLISYLMYKKTKEISIRKIHGASALNLYIISIKSILYSLMISSLIALPVTFFWLNKWLDNFAYRIEISYWLFLLPILTIVVIALLTTLSSVLKVIFVNPIETLKVE